MLDSIGITHAGLGERQKALPILRQARDKQAIAVTLNNIGFVYADLGQREAAQGYYRQALEIQHSLPGGRDEEARTLNTIGLLYEEMGDHEKARGSFNQALPIWQTSIAAGPPTALRKSRRCAGLR